MMSPGSLFVSSLWEKDISGNCMTLFISVGLRIHLYVDYLDYAESFSEVRIDIIDSEYWTKIS